MRSKSPEDKTIVALAQAPATSDAEDAGEEELEDDEAEEDEEKAVASKRCAVRSTCQACLTSALVPSGRYRE